MTALQEHSPSQHSGLASEPAFDNPAVRDEFWEIYRAWQPMLAEKLAEDLQVDPEFAAVLAQLPKSDLKAQQHLSRELLTGAFESGNWEPYRAHLLAQGATYARMGVSFAAWFRVLGLARRHLLPTILDRCEAITDIAAILGAEAAFFDWGMAAIGQGYLEAKEQIIRDQQVAIRELSTPVLQVGEKLLLVPVIGMVDTYRARQLTDGVLAAIRQRRAKAVIIDLSGVPAVDSKVANHLLNIVEAARLMGARSVLTGLSAEIARTLVTLGVDVSKVATACDLQEGVRWAGQLMAVGDPRARAWTSTKIVPVAEAQPVALGAAAAEAGPQA